MQRVRIEERGGSLCLSIKIGGRWRGLVLREEEVRMLLEVFGGAAGRKGDK